MGSSTKHQCEQAANTRLNTLLLSGRLKSFNAVSVDSCSAFNTPDVSLWPAGGVPERVYAVDAARHVLPVVDVCGFGVEDLKPADRTE